MAIGVEELNFTFYLILIKICVCVCVCESHSIFSDSVTQRTIQSMEFSRPEYWSGGIRSLLQGIFPTQGGIELGSPALQAGDSLPADSLPAEPPLILFNSSNWLLYCIGQLLNVILGLFTVSS